MSVQSDRCVNTNTLSVFLVPKTNEDQSKREIERNEKREKRRERERERER